MLIKAVAKSFSFIFIVSLAACSAEPNNYLAIIDEYEAEIAKIDAQNAITFAANLAQQTYIDVELPSFMDQPIPTHYMSYHKGLGIDVSKLNYSDSDWVINIRNDDKRVAEYNLAHPSEEDGHGH